MTTYATRNRRKGSQVEAGAILADLRQLARPQCEQCGQPARNRFGIVRLCDRHASEAMTTAYAMEGAL